MNIPCHAALNATSHEEAFFNIAINIAINVLFFNEIAINVLFFNVLFALFNEIDT